MPARSYLKQTYQASSETYDTPSSNTNTKLGSNAMKSNLGVYTSPRILNPRDHQRPPPPPPHRTHYPNRLPKRGKDEARRTFGQTNEGLGNASAPSGRQSSIDPDLANLNRYTGNDNLRPPLAGTESDAEQAPTPKQATAKDDRSHDNLFIFIFFFHTT